MWCGAVHAESTTLDTINNDINFIYLWYYRRRGYFKINFSGTLTSDIIIYIETDRVIIINIGPRSVCVETAKKPNRTR